MELLRYVAHGLVPSDVESSVKSAANKVLRAARGTGVIREIADYVLTCNEKK